MKEISEYFDIIVEAVLKVGLFVFAIISLKAFRGEDGKFQIEEVAKAIITGLLIYVIIRDGNRTQEWRYFSDWTVGALIAGVFTVAGLGHLVKLLFNIKNEPNKETDRRSS